MDLTIVFRAFGLQVEKHLRALGQAPGHMDSIGTQSNAVNGIVLHRKLPAEVDHGILYRALNIVKK